MIDRAPDLAAARAAAAELAPSLASQGDCAAEHASTARASSPASAIAGSREQLEKFVAMLVLNLSVGAARRWGAHWVYNQQECAAVSAAALDVAELYLDELDGPWTNLVVVLVATAVPRMLGEKQPRLVDAEVIKTTAPNTEAAAA